MMFSATLSKEIRPVCKKFMQDVIQLIRYVVIQSQQARAIVRLIIYFPPLPFSLIPDKSLREPENSISQLTLPTFCASPYSHCFNIPSFEILGQIAFVTSLILHKKHCSIQRGRQFWVGGWWSGHEDQSTEKKEDEERRRRGSFEREQGQVLTCSRQAVSRSFTFRYLSYSVIKIIRRECGLNAVAAHFNTSSSRKRSAHGLHVHL